MSAPAPLAELASKLYSLPQFINLNGTLQIVSNCALVARMDTMSSLTFNWFESIILSADWFASSDTVSDGKKIYKLEPTLTTKIATGKRLYHVTHASNCTSIDKGGLTPRSGGTTWLGRTYPHRTYFATTLWDAMIFLHSKISGGACIAGPDTLSDQALQDWEIYETLADRDRYPLDPWMPTAIWKDYATPSSELTKVLNWRKNYHIAASWHP